MKNEQPLISVIIPVYNVEMYLDRCLKSVVNQTYQNLEIFLIDDGSKDSSGDICDRWAKKDPRIRVLHQENGGLANARNNALRLIKGELVGFVDSDDWIDEDYYLSLYKIMKSKDADVVSCMFKQTNTEKRRNSMLIRKKMFDTVNAKDYYLKNIIKGKNDDASCCTKLYKRKVLENIEFENGLLFEDVVFNWLVLNEIEKYVKIYASKYYYFLNGDSITHKAFSDKMYDLIKGAAIMMEASENDKAIIKEKLNVYLVKCHFSILIRMLRSKNVEKCKLEQELRYLKSNKMKLLRSSLSISRKLAVVVLLLFPEKVICSQLSKK